MNAWTYEIFQISPVEHISSIKHDMFNTRIKSCISKHPYISLHINKDQKAALSKVLF